MFRERLDFDKAERLFPGQISIIEHVLQPLAETVSANNTTLDLDYMVHYLDISGTKAFTLPVATVLGHRCRIECVGAASTPVGTLTIADAYASEPTSWIFNNVGQRLELEWTSTGWKMISVRAAGTDTPAAASTLNLLVQTHVIAITGTQDWIIPSGVVPGQIQVFKVASAASTPVGTISGLFVDEDGSADGVDINFDAAADMATVVWNGARWDPIQLVSATVS